MSLSFVVSFAQAGLAGPGQFPQFRTFGGLPGNGYGLRRDGSTGRGGAWTLSVPVAYVPKALRGVVSASLAGNSLRPPFNFERGGNAPSSNFTGQVAFGVPLFFLGDAYFSHTVLSSYLDNSHNAQWAPPGQSGRIRYAIGVQDAAGQGGTAGMDPNRNDPGESRSWYGVATAEFNPGTYLTLGFGDTRFKGRLFGAGSYSVGPWTAHAEWDTFNINAGIGYTSEVFGQTAFFGVGAVDGRYGYWSVSVAF